MLEEIQEMMKYGAEEACVLVHSKLREVAN